MKVTITYSAIVLSLWILGMVMDVLGLYIGVKFATLQKVKSSKVGYCIMRFGEILIRYSTGAMMFVLTILIAEFLNII